MLMQFRLGVFGAVAMAACFAPQAAFADTGSATAASDANTTKPATPDPAALAEARGIITDGVAAKDRPVVFEGIVQMIQERINAQVGHVPFDKEPALKTIYERHNAAMQQQLNKLIADRTAPVYEALAVAYTQEFSLSELRDIRKFVGTSSGRNFLSRSNRAMGNPGVVQSYQSAFEEGSRMGDAMVEALRKDLEEYAEKNPDAAKRLMETDQK